MSQLSHKSASVLQPRCYSEVARAFRPSAVFPVGNNMVFSDSCPIVPSTYFVWDPDVSIYSLVACLLSKNLLMLCSSRMLALLALVGAASGAASALAHGPPAAPHGAPRNK